MEAVIGFFGGVLVSFVLWIVFVFAPVAAFGNVDAEMPGWAMAASIWFSFGCGLIGAVIGWKRL